MVSSFDRLFAGFKYINYICSFLSFTLVILLTLVSFLVNCKEGFNDINNSFNKTGLYIPKKFAHKLKNNQKIFKSAMCLTKFHNLNLIQIASLAQITYYDDINQIKYFLENSVFNGVDNIKISDMKIISKKDGILIMTDLDIKDTEGVRVFSIRGTKAYKDFLLDVECSLPGPHFL